MALDDQLRRFKDELLALERARAFRAAVDARLDARDRAWWRDADDDRAWWDRRADALRRFDDEWRASERSTYHSVSHPETEPSNSRDLSFLYRPLDLPAPYQNTTTFTSEDRTSEDRSSEDRLTLARFIPQDGRIELGFDFHWQAQRDIFHLTIDDLQSSATAEKLQARAESNIQSLANFFEQDFPAFGAFIVWDIDPSNPDVDVRYNIGFNKPYVDIPVNGHPRGETHQSILNGQELLQSFHPPDVFLRDNTQPNGIAPWQRIILCQGLSLASALVVEPESKQKKTLPFLVFDDENDPIQIATQLHLSNKRRGGSDTTNPYTNRKVAFHITFFERLRGLKPENLLQKSRNRRLKIGTLYDKPREDTEKNGKRNDDNLAFQQSSFTMIMTGAQTKIEHQSSNDRYWTMLILSPSGFFPLPDQQERKIDWKIRVGQSSRLVAELSCIVHALIEVEARWRQFNEYIGSLLVEDSFMDPEAYSKLLFDDETFSRSRLYFWIIGCLNEFDVSIEDNIKQYSLFQQARILPILDLPREVSSKLSKSSAPQSDNSGEHSELRELDKEAGEIRQSLEDLKAQFRAKLVTVQALRDGLFNASALMESRSSTRLGQNVQLLTYVSIFYLPLAFCAALWAIPNITDGNTRSPFIITSILVGLVTYSVVFNLGNIAKFLGRAYFSQRTRLLKKMEKDADPSWQEFRKRFEEFPPNEERKIPSEWWLILYQIRTWFKGSASKRAKSTYEV